MHARSGQHSVRNRKHSIHVSCYCYYWHCPKFGLFQTFLGQAIIVKWFETQKINHHTESQTLLLTSYYCVSWWPHFPRLGKRGSMLSEACGEDRTAPEPELRSTLILCFPKTPLCPPLHSILKLTLAQWKEQMGFEFRQT